MSKFIVRTCLGRNIMHLLPGFEDITQEENCNLRPVRRGQQVFKSVHQNILPKSPVDNVIIPFKFFLISQFFFGMFFIYLCYTFFLKIRWLCKNKLQWVFLDRSVKKSKMFEFISYRIILETICKGRTKHIVMNPSLNARTVVK